MKPFLLYFASARIVPIAAGALLLCTMEAWAQVSPPPETVGYCGGVTPVMEVVGPLPPSPRAGPLNMQARWAAVVVGTANGPFNIMAGVNDQVKLTINGVNIPAITLTAGAARTAEQVGTDLRNNQTFNINAIATTAGGAVLIRSWSLNNGVVNGTIQIEAIANSADATLGFNGGMTGISVTAAQQAVIQQAMTDWQAVVLETGTIQGSFPVDVAYYPTAAFAGNPLAIAGPVTSGSTIIGGRVQVNQNHPWYEVLTTPVTAGQFDLLSVIRHELGHTLGISSVFSGSDLGNVAFFKQSLQIQALNPTENLMLFGSTAGFPAAGQLCILPPETPLEAVLTQALTDTAPTMQVESGSTAGFPSAGKLSVDSENMSYAGTTPTSFIGLVRGINGVAAAHALGASVKSLEEREDLSYTGKTANTFTGLGRGLNETTAGGHSATSLIVSLDFDSPRLNIATVHCGAHTRAAAHANDLMNPSVAMGVRRPISLYPAGAYIARAYNGDIPMAFIDAAFAGSSAGTANAPWTSLVQAIAQEAAGEPFLMISGTYNVSPLPFTISEAHSIQAARGSVATVR